MTDNSRVAALGASTYDLSVYGPNGFHRAFKGGASGHAANLEIRAVYNEERNAIALAISNRASRFARVSVFNRYTSRTTTLDLRPGDAESRS